MEQPGYEDCVCHFCGGKEAGFARAEDKKPTGPYFDACQKCAERMYPAQKEETNAVQEQRN